MTENGPVTGDIGYFDTRDEAQAFADRALPEGRPIKHAPLSSSELRDLLEIVVEAERRQRAAAIDDPSYENWTAAKVLELGSASVRGAYAQMYTQERRRPTTEETTV